MAGGGFGGRGKVRSSRSGLELVPIPPSPALSRLRPLPCHCSIRARRDLYVLAVPADGVAPTALVPGVVPAAPTALADLSTARRGRSRQVSSARKK